MRAGSFALTLLAEPLQVQALTALREGALPFRELHRRLGLPPPSTAHRHLRTLVEINAVSHRQGRLGGNHAYALTGSGQELSGAADNLSRWLAGSPPGPVAIGSSTAKAAVKSLDDAWSSPLARALSVRPLTLTELDSLITKLTYPQLERRLASMRRTGQIEACGATVATRGRTPYTATRWFRRAIAPVIAAILWERAHLPTKTAPITRIDMEAILLLAVPVLTLPHDLGGSCRLVAELERDGRHQHAGVMVEVSRGRVVSCSSRLAGNPGSSASASPRTWLSAMTERDPRRLAVQGGQPLAEALLAAMHDFLFSAR